MKLDRGLAPRTAELDEISIADVDISFLHAVTLTEVYSFLAYLSRDRVRQPNAHEPEYGLSASSRARKIAAIRSFFKYLTVKAKLLEETRYRISTPRRYQKPSPTISHWKRASGCCPLWMGKTRSAIIAFCVFFSTVVCVSRSWSV